MNITREQQKLLARITEITDDEPTGIFSLAVHIAEKIIRGPDADEDVTATTWMHVTDLMLDVLVNHIKEDILAFDPDEDEEVKEQVRAYYQIIKGE